MSTICSQRGTDVANLASTFLDQERTLVRPHRHRRRPHGRDRHPRGVLARARQSATLQLLRKQIASGETDPLYLLVGDDDIEKSAVAAEFAEMVDEGLRAFNVERLYGGEMKVDDLVDAASTLPMMAPRRVVIVFEAEKLLIPKRESKAADEEQERLEAFIEAPAGARDGRVRLRCARHAPPCGQAADEARRRSSTAAPSRARPTRSAGSRRGRRATGINLDPATPSRARGASRARHRAAAAGLERVSALRDGAADDYGGRCQAGGAGGTGGAGRFRHRQRDPAERCA